ncbi:PREDICTED: uncharacterized protein LOC109230222 [Nicotiana attenuata]|uniref:uncharacterized protein LOC109230222 n=1 Tax=Nicotiana attenuata TaxID=49451 RepID=UPI0009057403|nr:PREDICTED: uncharacterized protein LOC109230222 [Nicotiana attenuata]
MFAIHREPLTPAHSASHEEKSMQTIRDDEEDFFAPRTFVAPEESDATKSTVEELEQTVLIDNLPDRKAIEEITVVNNVKAVQRLTGRIAALGRFISRSSDKSHRFFALLRRKRNFEWTPECQDAMEELKRYLSSPPLLHTPKEDEMLYLYLAISEIAVSGVLVREDQGTQFPVYYASPTLGDAETRYPHLEKLALALISASRKLKPYFQCHRICVLSTYPLQSILHKPELSGRLAKWAIELGGYDIEYQPRTDIKSHILADFVDDFSPSLVPEVEKELLLKSGTSSGVWTLFTESATNVRGSGLGIVLKPPIGGVIRQSIKTVKLTNNEAEYEAIIAGLELAKGLGAKSIEAKCDSLLVVSQVNGSYEAREDRMHRYLDKIQVTLRRFKEWTLVLVPREQNSEADALAKLGSSAEEEDLLPGAVVQLIKSAVDEAHAEINSTSLTWDWRNKYITYLKDGKLTADPKESKALGIRAARFSLDESGALYRRTFDDPLAVCLGLGDMDYVLREIHEGTCGNHSGAESLVRKVIRAGYYWDSMERDAKEFVRKCDKCQKFAP